MNFKLGQNASALFYPVQRQNIFYTQDKGKDVCGNVCGSPCLQENTDLFMNSVMQTQSGGKSRQQSFPELPLLQELRGFNLAVLVKLSEKVPFFLF